MPEIKEAIKEKIEELTFAHYEGVIQGLLIIVVDKGSFKIMPAYDNNARALINMALDLAKTTLMEETKANATKEIKND